MEVGKFEKEQPGLLWMPTIMSIIEYQTIFAENIAILHQEMDLLQILLLWHMIKMDIKWAFNTQVLLINFHYFLTQYYTLRFVNNSMHGLVDINQSSNV